MKIPYALVPAVGLDQRHVHMASAITRGLPRLQAVPIDDRRTMSVACYGPSLADTWRTLTRPIISMSGATRWLATRGMVPDYHVDMDPRENKIRDVQPPIKGVHYLMASVCCPAVFDALRSERVTLWHTFSGEIAPGHDTYGWVAQHDRPGELVIRGGSTIGLTALHIGGVLGYRHFEVHGMDGSFADDSRSRRHAGPHNADGITRQAQQDGITWAAGGRTYQTSKIMANAVAETIRTMEFNPVFCVFHGEGLTQALLREAQLRNACCADERERADRVRKAAALIAPLPQPVGRKGAVRTFWDALLSRPEANVWLTGAMVTKERAEPRRARARYNTGSVGLETAILLRGLVHHYKPTTVIEVGTFIGTSTEALAASGATVYTCDSDNDCLPASDRIVVHPQTPSTAMFERLAAAGVVADLVFLDGRLRPGDLPLLERVTHQRTVYAFDDYTGTEKGAVNVRMLVSQLPSHLLIEPEPSFAGRSTLAALVPRKEWM